jgi:hypothetical protein
MNKERRKAITAATALVEAARNAMDEARVAIEAIRDEEQEYYDAMPESIQSGEKGEAAQTAIETLDNAISELENFDFDGVINQIEEAAA